MKYTGFHPQGEEEREPALDLTSLIIRNPAITIYALMVGDAMTEAQIHDGDLLVIEAAEHYANGSVVLAFVDGEAVVRRLQYGLNAPTLLPANRNYPAIDLKNVSQWLIRGKVLAAVTLLFPARFPLPKVE